MPTPITEHIVIFLSHNHADKPLVEHVALRLAEVFGKDNVFYDSWSIQPGDGIIDRMSDALAKVSHFFFFVSENSLKSRMVSLEWQNALLKATQGKCKLIPVRCDASELPPIMAQTLYIDLYSVGIDAAVGQMVDVVRGASTYKGPNQPFSNLRFSISGSDREMEIVVKAMHYLEPIASVLILIENEESDFEVQVINEDPIIRGFHPAVPLTSGEIVNAFLVKLFRGLTPAMPLRIKLRSNGEIPLKFRGMLHQKSHERWEPIPIVFTSTL